LSDASARRRLRVGADLGNLAGVRDFVMEMATLASLDTGAAQGVRLAVDEAMANIIQHGYRDSAGEVEIEAEAGPEGLLIRLRDTAPPYNPLDRPPPALDVPLEERPFGGMGVQLIRENVDTVEHRVTAAGGNELTMFRRRS